MKYGLKNTKYWYGGKQISAGKKGEWKCRDTEPKNVLPKCYFFPLPASVSQSHTPAITFSNNISRELNSFSPSLLPLTIPCSCGTLRSALKSLDAHFGQLGSDFQHQQQKKLVSSHDVGKYFEKDSNFLFCWFLWSLKPLTICISGFSLVLLLPWPLPHYFILANTVFLSDSDPNTFVCAIQQVEQQCWQIVNASSFLFTTILSLSASCNRWTIVLQAQEESVTGWERQERLLL